MDFLLDTNIPSETVRKRPEERVVRWLDAQVRKTLFLSAVSFGELRKGISLMPEGRAKVILQSWLDEEITSTFSGRILPFDQAIANHWGMMQAQRQRAGRPISTTDALIAATAIEHGLTLVTRNVRDFEGLGIQLLNPWEL